MGRKQKFGYVKDMLPEREIFTLGPVSCIAVDFKRMVSDLFHTGPTLVESECIKRKTRLSEYPSSIAIAQDRSRLQYQRTLQILSQKSEVLMFLRK